MTNVLTQKDLEAIERIIVRSNDDLAVSIARGLERLEERIAATEGKLTQNIAFLRDVLR